jgi:hypothetical protein
MNFSLHSIHLTKATMRNLFLTAVCLLGCAGYAQPFQWTTYTSTSNVANTLIVN